MTGKQLPHRITDHVQKSTLYNFVTKAEDFYSYKTDKQNPNMLLLILTGLEI